MSIGTAKPARADMEGVQHYFIDEFSVADQLSAADFEQLGEQYLQEIFAVKDTAVVCGGTGLYIKALCEGLDQMPQVAPATVDALQREFEERGLAWLQQAVAAEDPEFYAGAETSNPARLLRALAFRRSTGESITRYKSGAPKQRPYSIIKTALELPRELLYERINTRVDRMMAEGLLDEVKTLYPLRQLKALNTVGYSELFDYLDHRCTLEEAVGKIKQHTRNYAKRQLTWFRNDPVYKWFSAADPALVRKLLALTRDGRY
jgi:tRNA dimethylallyltransferase